MPILNARLRAVKGEFDDTNQSINFPDLGMM